jgi:hypothetical protein
MPLYIPEIFSEEEFLEIGNASNMPIESKCACLKSTAFIPNVAPQIEGLSAIMSKEWTEEAEESCRYIDTSYDYRVLFCAIGDAEPQEAAYDLKVGVNIISSALAMRIAPDEPLSYTRKHLKWRDGQMLESKGILRVVPLHMGRNKVFLDFYVFDIHKGDKFFLIGQPIEHLVNPNHDRATVQLRVGKEYVPISLVRSLNTMAEARSEQDLVEEVLSIIQEENTQPISADDANHFVQEVEPGGYVKLDKEESPQPPPPELKPLPSGLRYSFLNNNHNTLVIISDKLTENEARRLVTVLEKYRSVLGYSLKDLKGISPNLCTHRIPMEPDHKPSREHQRRLNDAMREVVKKEVLKLLHAGIIYPV